MTRVRVLLRGVRFALERAAEAHATPGREREFVGHAYSAFLLLSEAERMRMQNRNGRGQKKRAVP